MQVLHVDVIETKKTRIYIAEEAIKIYNKKAEELGLYTTPALLYHVLNNHEIVFGLYPSPNNKTQIATFQTITELMQKYKCISFSDYYLESDNYKELTFRPFIMLKFDPTTEKK